MALPPREHREYHCHLPPRLPSRSPRPAQPRGLADVTLQSPRSPPEKKEDVLPWFSAKKREQISLATLGIAQRLQPLGQGSQTPPGPLERSARLSPA